jgi:hypothetical protein
MENCLTEDRDRGVKLFAEPTPGARLAEKR